MKSMCTIVCVVKWNALQLNSLQSWDKMNTRLIGYFPQLIY